MENHEERLIRLEELTFFQEERLEALNAALTAQQREWLERAAHESSLKQRELWKEADKIAVERAGKQGVQFLEVDKSAFAEKLRPLRENQPERIMKYVKRIGEVKE